MANETPPAPKETADRKRAIFWVIGLLGGIWFFFQIPGEDWIMQAWKAAGVGGSTAFAIINNNRVHELGLQAKEAGLPGLSPIGILLGVAGFFLVVTAYGTVNTFWAGAGMIVSWIGMLVSTTSFAALSKKRDDKANPKGAES